VSVVGIVHAFGMSLENARVFIRRVLEVRLGHRIFQQTPVEGEDGGRKRL
jgi:hypothetical protein